MDLFDYSKFIQDNVREHSETDMSKEFGGLLRDHPDLESFDLGRYDFEVDECVVCVKRTYSGDPEIRYKHVLITNYLRFLLVEEYTKERKKRYYDLLSKGDDWFFKQDRAGPNLEFINVDDEYNRDVPIKLPFDYVDLIYTYEFEYGDIDKFCEKVRETFKYVCQKYNHLRSSDQ